MSIFFEMNLHLNVYHNVKESKKCPQLSTLMSNSNAEVILAVSLPIYSENNKVDTGIDKWSNWLLEEPNSLLV